MWIIIQSLLKIDQVLIPFRRQKLNVYCESIGALQLQFLKTLFFVLCRCQEKPNFGQSFAGTTILGPTNRKFPRKWICTTWIRLQKNILLIVVLLVQIFFLHRSPLVCINMHSIYPIDLCSIALCNNWICKMWHNGNLI